MSTAKKPPTVILKYKKVTLTTETRNYRAEISAFEFDRPYALTIIAELDNEQQSQLQIDLDSNDISRELRRWLNGDCIEFPAFRVAAKIEEQIMRYVKYGKVPDQVDFIMWLLSRSEIILGSKKLNFIFGGRLEESQASSDLKDPKCETIKNPFPKTTEAAATREKHEKYWAGELYDDDGEDDGKTEPSHNRVSHSKSSSLTGNSKSRPLSAPPQTSSLALKSLGIYVAVDLTHNCYFFL